MELGLTRQDVLKYVEDSLGVPAIKMYTPVNSLNSQMDYVLDHMSRRKPRVKFDTLAASPGKQGYYIDPDKLGYGILDIMVPRLDPIAPLMLSNGPRMDIFGYRYSYPYRDIAELEIDYIYFEMASKVLSSDLDWEYIDQQLFLYPAPVDTFQFTYAYAVRKQFGDKDTNTQCTIPLGDWDWCKDAVLARVKMIEGHILSRFKDVPGSSFTQSSNGPELLAEGKDDWTRLLDTLESRTPNIPFSKGGSGGRLIVGIGQVV